MPPPLKPVENVLVVGCAAALLPVGVTRLSLMVQVHRRGTLREVRQLDNVPAEECPLRDVVHEGAILPAPSSGEHLLVSIEAGSIVVIRDCLFGGTCTVPVDVQAPGVVAQCVRWDMPPLHLRPQSLNRVPL